MKKLLFFMCSFFLFISFNYSSTDQDEKTIVDMLQRSSSPLNFWVPKISIGAYTSQINLQTKSQQTNVGTIFFIEATWALNGNFIHKRNQEIINLFKKIK